MVSDGFVGTAEMSDEARVYLFLCLSIWSAELAGNSSMIFNSCALPIPMVVLLGPGA